MNGTDANAPASASSEESAAADTSLDPTLDALWTHVLEDFDAEARHNAVLAYAAQQQKLPELARLYRGERENPARTQICDKKMQGIVVAATMLLESAKTPKRASIPWSITLSAFAVAAILIGLLAHALLRR